MGDQREKAIFGKVETSPEVRGQAILVIMGLHASGKLQPIDGWDGELIDGYYDILGLNGRKLRETSRFHRQRGHSSPTHSM